jgi:hypothetical protein
MKRIITVLPLVLSAGCALAAYYPTGYYGSTKYMLAQLSFDLGYC